MPEVLLSSAGISKSLLDQINLQDIDVIKGKKYIGSDGKLHTGSLVDQPNDNQCPVVTKYDPDTNFVYLAIPRGAYRKTDGRMSPHPNIKRRLREIVGEAGFDRGQYQYAGGVGSGTDENGKYFGLNKIPEGFYSSNGADWAPEVRVDMSTFVSSFATIFRPTQVYSGSDNGNTGSSTNFNATYTMTKNQILLFVGNIGCSEGHHPSLALSTPNCTELYNLDFEHTQDWVYQSSRLIIRIVKVNSNGNAAMTGAAPTIRSSVVWYVVRLVG